MADHCIFIASDIGTAGVPEIEDYRGVRFSVRISEVAGYEASHIFG
jgi:hypothetical protein